MQTHELTGSVLLSDDESISVMVNEEDHIRIQCLFPGLQIEEAYEQADNLDRVLEKELSMLLMNILVI